jgi:hypothetical protein
MVTKYLVFCYSTADRRDACFLIDSLDENTEDSNKQSSSTFGDFKVKAKHPGCIYEVVQSEKGVTYTTNCLPKSYWKNKDSVTTWRALQRGEEGTKTFLTNVKRNTLVEALEPIRSAYKQSAYRERQLILAEIIRIVTS